MTLKFSDLTAKRKFAIQQLLEAYPEVKETGLLTFKQFQTWWTAYDQDPTRQIGYPRWMVANPDTKSDKRGVFRIPLPTSEAEYVTLSGSKKVKTLADLTPRKKTTKITVSQPAISDTDFEAECLAAGITL